MIEGGDREQQGLEDHAEVKPTKASCCPDCFLPEHDTTGEDYRGAVPESCKDEDCACHHPLGLNVGDESGVTARFGG